ncbi:MAG: DUF3106 domain-containing protein [Porticoccaceae bacterium]|jgi:hypothetical protein|nr:DUF3106 domain-containing protein [Alphaproteobacteria bacterium]MDP4745665.1 DUF3106 domain-containing protein [Porticoccaceae bacterium]MDP4753889.1 DUF3106 domain-containing protein [Porticoccaceae bacterium]MDP4890488.1 DUF3106 domain-containing protein [Porticoccaceae bacterium]
MMIKTYFYTLLFTLFIGSALPAAAQSPQEPDAIAWRDLPDDVRQTLAPIANRWDSLTPRQQQQMLRRAGDKNLKNRAQEWEKMSPEERQQVRNARQKFQQMPPEQRRELRDQWQNMSPEERREAIDARKALREPPPAAHHRRSDEVRSLPPHQRGRSIEHDVHRPSDDDRHNERAEKRGVETDKSYKKGGAQNERKHERNPKQKR